MNISLSEIAVTLLIALLVIKPAQLPEAARALGRFVRFIQNQIGKIKEEVNGLLDAADKRDEPKK